MKENFEIEDTEDLDMFIKSNGIELIDLEELEEKIFIFNGTYDLVRK